MKKFPEVTKQPLDLVTPAREIARRAQNLVVSATLSSASLFGLGTIPTWASAPIPLAPPSAILSLREREKKTPTLVLTLANDNRGMVAQHRSHSSHSSHSSHASHYSGAAPRAPASTPAPYTPPAEVETKADSLVELTVSRIDRERRTVWADSSSGKGSVEFQYRDDTKVQMGTLGASVRLDDYLEKNPSQLPFGVGQKVRIEWRSSTDGTKKIAAKIIVLG